MEDGKDERPTVADGPPSGMDDHLAETRQQMIGTDVAGYIIDDEIGRGGMGVVYSATHPMIGKRVAIKVLKKSLSNNPATVERFIQEARSVNQIGHPNIVDIFGFGSLPDGRSYLIMDLLEGEPLRKRVKRGRLPVQEATLVIDEIACALIAAHDKGFIHRDLKPDNVFLVANPNRLELRLLDFGLAKLASTSALSMRAFRTATGAQLGTPDYMSPEQLKSSNVDARTDIYALGVMSFEILVGGRPRRVMGGAFELEGKSVAEVVRAVDGVPAELAELVETMMAADPTRRPSLAAVRAVLKRVRPSLPPSALDHGTSSGRAGLDGPRAIGTMPALESLTPALVGAEPMVAPSKPPVSQPPVRSSAGLRAAGAVHPATKLGVPPPPERAQHPHPVQAQRRPAGRESHAWIVVAVILVLVAAATLVFVLVT